MRVELFGLAMETPAATFYLWSPWRCSFLEHKLFDALKGVPGAELEPGPDELRLTMTDPKAWKVAVQSISRVMKGWQEEASDAGKEERRAWRWLLEADVDAAGYDMQAEKSSFWAYLRLSLDRGGPNDGEKGEDIDLNGFGVQICGLKE
ncbi:MAG TPA: hypothetical protein VN641_14330 [Urbifossiella sp.]|jgi:hypothetical protein|nr:hypothetical protein [Urbifossiella sp.]